VRQRSLDQMKGRMHAEIDHPVPDARSGLRKLGKDDEAGVVDEHVEAPEAIHRQRDDAPARVGVLQVLVTGSRDPAAGGNLLGDAVRDRRIKAVAVRGHAGIVYDHGSAPRGQEPGVRSPETTPGAGDDGHLAVKANLRGVSHRCHRASRLSSRAFSGSSSRAMATARGAVSIG
jgi:hypothetical protein